MSIPGYTAGIMKAHLAFFLSKWQVLKNKIKMLFLQYKFLRLRFWNLKKNLICSHHALNSEVCAFSLIPWIAICSPLSPPQPLSIATSRDWWTPGLCTSWENKVLWFICFNVHENSPYMGVSANTNVGLNLNSSCLINHWNVGLEMQINYIFYFLNSNACWPWRNCLFQC